MQTANNRDNERW